MEIAVYITLGLITTTWCWLTFVGCYVIIHDETLNSFQKKTQLIFVLCIPFIGGALVLHLVNLHSPGLIPRSLIPWPFKSAVFCKNNKPNRNRDENEDNGIDLALNSRNNDFNDTSSGHD